MDGLIVVDKPSGPTSHDVVARVRRVLGEKRVGHTGTLDPLASGVMALVVGRATRLAQFMGGDTKAYDARVRLGFNTETDDAEGNPVGGTFTGPWPALDAVTEAVASVLGTRPQRPPAYSAKKIGGRRSYALARQRAREAAERPPGTESGPALAEMAAPEELPAPAEVTLIRCVVTGYADGHVDLSLECSAGFYVRSLAHKLGERLGTGGHLAVLRRTRSGSATLVQATALAELELSRGRSQAALIPMAAMLPALPALVLTESGVQRVAHGNVVGPADFAPVAEPSQPAPLEPEGGVRRESRPGQPAAFRLLSGDGMLLAIGRPTQRPGFLHPSVVLM